MLASQLGTPLFVPNKRGLGRASNRVCIGWNVSKTPPKCMVVNVGASLISISLNFGTYFGACFDCNKFGHFAKDCPMKANQESTSKQQDCHMKDRQVTNPNALLKEVFQEQAREEAQGGTDVQMKDNKEVSIKDDGGAALVRNDGILEQEKAGAVQKVIPQLSKGISNENGFVFHSSTSKLYTITTSSAIQVPVLKRAKRVKVVARETRTNDKAAADAHKGKGLSPLPPPLQGGKKNIPLYNPFEALIEENPTDAEEQVASPTVREAENEQSSDVEEFVPLSP